MASAHGPSRQEPPGLLDTPVNRREYIENPLTLLTREAVVEDVKRFHDTYKLRPAIDLDTLQKGARLAQYRRAWDRVHQSLFTPEERAALEREIENSLWSQLRQIRGVLVIVLGTCAIGAVLQGWTQESIVGANLKWPAHFDLIDENDRKFKGSGLTWFALVNAMPWFTASVVGVWVIDPISALRGRRAALLFAAICSFAGPVGAYFSQSWGGLLACRCVQGVGMGAKASVIPVLESEMVPAKLRGRLLVIWQTFVAVGTMFGASTNLIFHDNWRMQIGIAFVAAVPLLCLCYVIPESPRWLIKKREYVKAYKTLVRLKETPVQACRDLYLIDRQLDAEMALRTHKNPTLEEVRAVVIDRAPQERQSLWTFFKRLRELFQFSRNRRAFYGAASVMIAQQFSGINIFAFLATSLFDSSDKHYVENLWIKFGFTVVNSIFSAIAFFLITVFGRRSLILSSMVAMLPLLVLTGYYLEQAAVRSKSPSTPDEPSLQLRRATPEVIVLLLLYTAVYSPGAGVIPFMYSSEVFSQHYREVGMSIAVLINFALAGVLAIVVSLNIRGEYRSYLNLTGVFAGLTAIAFGLVWVFMRSPRHSDSLEEINFMFDRGTRDYVQYQLQHATPRTIIRLLLMPFPSKQRPDKVEFSKWCDDREQAKINGTEENGRELPNRGGQEARQEERQQEI